MKNVAILAFLITALTACKKSNTGIGENSVTEGQCLNNIKSRGISVCFNNLEEDSRCPINAVCIWRGVAIANLTFKNGAKEVTFKLADYTFPGFINDTTIDNVRIILKKVSPYPGEDGYGTKKKTAVIEIE
jgi:hypothetical protein